MQANTTTNQVSHPIPPSQTFNLTPSHPRPTNPTQAPNPATKKPQSHPSPHPSPHPHQHQPRQNPLRARSRPSIPEIKIELDQMLSEAYAELRLQPRKNVRLGGRDLYVLDNQVVGCYVGAVYEEYGIGDPMDGVGRYGGTGKTRQNIDRQDSQDRQHQHIKPNPNPTPTTLTPPPKQPNPQKIPPNPRTTHTSKKKPTYTPHAHSHLHLTPQSKPISIDFSRGGKLGPAVVVGSRNDVADGNINCEQGSNNDFNGQNHGHLGYGNMLGSHAKIDEIEYRTPGREVQYDGGQNDGSENKMQYSIQSRYGKHDNGNQQEQVPQTKVYKQSSFAINSNKNTIKNQIKPNPPKNPNPHTSKHSQYPSNPTQTLPNTPATNSYTLPHEFISQKQTQPHSLNPSYSHSYAQSQAEQVTPPIGSTPTTSKNKNRNKGKNKTTERLSKLKQDIKLELESMPTSIIQDYNRGRMAVSMMAPQTHSQHPSLSHTLQFTHPPYIDPFSHAQQFQQSQKPQNQSSHPDMPHNPLRQSKKLHIKLRKSSQRSVENDSVKNGGGNGNERGKGNNNTMELRRQQNVDIREGDLELGNLVGVSGTSKFRMGRSSKNIHPTKQHINRYSSPQPQPQPIPPTLTNPPSHLLTQTPHKYCLMCEEPLQSDHINTHQKICHQLQMLLNTPNLRIEQISEILDRKIEGIERQLESRVRGVLGGSDAGRVLGIVGWVRGKGKGGGNGVGDGRMDGGRDGRESYANLGRNQVGIGGKIFQEEQTGNIDQREQLHSYQADQNYQTYNDIQTEPRSPMKISIPPAATQQDQHHQPPQKSFRSKFKNKHLQIKIQQQDSQFHPQSQSHQYQQHQHQHQSEPVSTQLNHTQSQQQQHQQLLSSFSMLDTIKCMEIIDKLQWFRRMRRKAEGKTESKAEGKGGLKVRQGRDVGFYGFGGGYDQNYVVSQHKQTYSHDQGNRMGMFGENYIRSNESIQHNMRANKGY